MAENDNDEYDYDDGDRVLQILQWLRAERYAVTRVRVGDCEIDIAADLKLAPSAVSLSSERSEADPYEAYGGQALQRLRDQETEVQRGDSMVTEDD